MQPRRKSLRGVDVQNGHPAFVGQDLADAVVLEAALEESGRLVEDFYITRVEIEPEPPGPSEAHYVAVAKVETEKLRVVRNIEVH
jgi:hypothetical protein